MNRGTPTIPGGVNNASKGIVLNNLDLLKISFSYLSPDLCTMEKHGTKQRLI